MEDGMTSAEGLTVADLVRMFEESEEATQNARDDAERDRDYYDNKQLTAAEKAVLAKRGQPPTVINRIKRKIDFLVGLEKEQRVNPKALPRTPKHEQDADGATQALAYVADAENFDNKRSSVWKNMLIEGAGGMSVSVEPGYDGKMKVKLRRVAWDRMFADPHSSDADYEDASYKGVVLWMDYDEAVIKYPGEKAALDSTLADAGDLSHTYGDKPKWTQWADKKRKRIRIVQIWIRRGDDWHFAEFTKGGILKAGPSPYKTDTGGSDCELIFQSAFVDRDNDRYGVVREMISPQDEINKRRSKALHLLSTAQIVMVDGAVKDVEAMRKEAVRPDGVIVVNPIGGSLNETFKFETRLDLAEAQFKLLQENKNEIDLMGPNSAMQGDEAGNSASGKAIIASQQGGMIEMGDLLDNLRHFDIRVFRAIWNRIRQFWTAEEWIRVTDDERNVKWVALNVPRDQIEMAMQQNPEMAKKIAGSVASVAELDCDITIADAPDSVTPQLEQWQALVELKKVDANGELPFKALVEAAPNLKNRERVLAAMEEAGQNPAAAQAQQIQMEKMATEIDVLKSTVAKNMAQAHQAMQPEQVQQPEMQQPEGPKPPSVSIAFGDMPPEAKAQALRRAGIMASPQEIMAYENEQQRQQAAIKAAARPSPQPRAA